MMQTNGIYTAQKGQEVISLSFQSIWHTIHLTGKLFLVWLHSYQIWGKKMQLIINVSFSHPCFPITQCHLETLANTQCSTHGYYKELSCEASSAEGLCDFGDTQCLEWAVSHYSLPFHQPWKKAISVLYPVLDLLHESGQLTHLSLLRHGHVVRLWRHRDTVRMVHKASTELPILLYLSCVRDNQAV